LWAPYDLYKHSHWCQFRVRHIHGHGD
jgi:hypothetical protein